MNRYARYFLWAVLAATCMLQDGAVQTAAAEEPALSRDAAIDKTRETLDSRWNYPWYDSKNDSLRRMSARRWDSWWPNWNLNRGAPQMNWLKWVMWLGVALVLGLVIYLLVRFFLARERDGGHEGDLLGGADSVDDATRVEELPFDIDPQGGNLFELARYYYDRGEFNQAVVYLYSHQLLELDRRHLIRLSKGKTNRQYLRELSPHNPLQRALERTMLAFEDAFFGDHPVSRERFEACWSDVPRFTQMAEGAAA